MHLHIPHSAYFFKSQVSSLEFPRYPSQHLVWCHIHMIDFHSSNSLISRKIIIRSTQSFPVLPYSPREKFPPFSVCPRRNPSLKQTDRPPKPPDQGCGFSNTYPTHVQNRLALNHVEIQTQTPNAELYAFLHISYSKSPQARMIKVDA